MTSANEYCFVHAADLHLDTPFRGVSVVAPAVAEALREASLEAFDNVVQLALDRHAAFVVIAGDIYDGPERGLRAQLRFRDGLARLAAGGIPSFVVHGNHDPVGVGWSAIGDRWPKDVTVFGSSTVSVVPVISGGQQIATVQGISYSERETRENLAGRFARPDGRGPHIGVLHCNVAGVSNDHDNYSPCTVEDLRQTGLDYLALGHIHERTIVARGESGDPWIVYPGNTQARSAKPSECQPKGAIVGHVSDGAVRSVEFVACDRVRFVLRSVTIGTVEDLADLSDELLCLGRACLDAAEGRAVVLRVRLVGRGGLHDDLIRPGVLEELLTSLRDAMSDSSPFLWWEQLLDETTPEIDTAALRARGDFTSDLLRLSEELLFDPTGIEALRAELLAGAPRALQGRLSDLLSDDTRSRELLVKATNVALDELLGDQK